MLTGAPQMAAGVAAGLAIGIVAALLGVAGGELLIPTLILLFGIARSWSWPMTRPSREPGFKQSTLWPSWYARTATCSARPARCRS
jgi:hypothetical protein